MKTIKKIEQTVSALLKSMLTLCVIAVPAVFTSCGGDDDGGGYGIDATIIETEDGDKLQVTRAGSTYYGYDDNGYIDYLKWEGYEYDGSSNATKFYYSGSYGEESIQLSYNGSGYISKATCKISSYYDDDDYYSDTQNASFSYDGSGHLTKISYSGSAVDMYDGEKDSYSFSGSITLTWSNGLLTTYVHSDKEGGDTYIETYTFDYDDGKYANAYKQHAPSSIGCGDDLLVFAFAYAGLCGKGPNYLPTTVEYTDYESWDDEEYTYSGSTSYTYSLNSDGTIYYQRAGSKSYTYFEYDDADSYFTSKAPSVAVDTETTSAGKKRLPGLFVRPSHRNKAK